MNLLDYNDGHCLNQAGLGLLWLLLWSSDKLNDLNAGGNDPLKFEDLMDPYFWIAVCVILVIPMNALIIINVIDPFNFWVKAFLFVVVYIIVCFLIFSVLKTLSGIGR